MTALLWLTAGPAGPPRLAGRGRPWTWGATRDA